MNTPNKLTLLRIILVPIFIAVLLIDSIPHHFLISIIIFAAASFTDMLDGKIARKTGAITDFGKFADPLADKILVMAAFICFVQLGISNAVVAMVILSRELTVTSIRLVASSKGKVIAANYWGKVKTVSQMVSILVVLTSNYILELLSIKNISLNFNIESLFSLISDISVYLSVLLTLISGIVYLYQNREIIKDLG